MVVESTSASKFQPKQLQRTSSLSNFLLCISRGRKFFQFVCITVLYASGLKNLPTFCFLLRYGCELFHPLLDLNCIGESRSDGDCQFSPNDLAEVA